MDKKLVLKRSMVAVAVLITVIVGIAAFYSVQPAEETAVLKMGSSGSQVRTLQTKLNNWGYNCGTVDGIFGSKTLAAVKQFQKIAHL